MIKRTLYKLLYYFNSVSVSFLFYLVNRITIKTWHERCTWWYQEDLKKIEILFHQTKVNI